MGAGIAAGILLTTTGYDNKELDKTCVPKSYLDHYTQHTEGKKIFYTIDEEFLLANYKGFIIEFYELIQEDLRYETRYTAETIPIVDNMDEFRQVFDPNKRNRKAPLLTTALAHWIVHVLKDGCFIWVVIKHS